MMNPMISQMMESLPEEVREPLKQIIEEEQAKLDKLTATGEAGGGMVKITVDAYNTITQTELDCEFTKENKTLVQHLIPAAHVMAIKKLNEVHQKSTSSMMTRVSSMIREFRNKQSREQDKNLN